MKNFVQSISIHVVVELIETFHLVHLIALEAQNVTDLFQLELKGSFKFRIGLFNSFKLAICLESVTYNEPFHSFFNLF